MPVTCLPDTQPIHLGYLYPLGTGVRDWLFNCKDPPCSLLMLAKVTYNRVSSGRGRFYRCEGVGYALFRITHVTPPSREERAHLYLSEKEIDSIMISEIIPNVM
jgi:hypothetical protein